MGLARQLAGSLQEQLQQQRTEATARELRISDEAREREQHLQQEALALSGNVDML